MAFGNQQGYPASHRQLQQLTELVVAAGHADLRDARGALGLTQRQAGGKFTRDEADELIARLEAAAEADTADEDAADDTAAVAPLLQQKAARTTEREASRAGALRAVPDAELAAELQRRGWIVVEP